MSVKYAKALMPCVKFKGAIVFIILFLSITPLSGQEEPTSTPDFAMRSIFQQDTCAPPCWFGLIAGTSTTEDVANTFRVHNDLFVVNPRGTESPDMSQWVTDLQPLIDGQSAEFFWREWRREDDRRILSFVEIEDGILSQLRVFANDDVTLAQTLDYLSRPFVIRAGWSLYELDIFLFYPDQRLIAWLRASRSHCQADAMSEEFKMFQMHYLSEEAYLYWATNYRNGTSYVPHRLWDDWMSGEVEGTCEEAIQALVDAAA